MNARRDSAESHGDASAARALRQVLGTACEAGWVGGASGAVSLRTFSHFAPVADEELAEIGDDCEPAGAGRHQS